METGAEILEDLRARYSRVERAILGDPSVGHIGLVARMERVEDDHRNVPSVHQGVEDRRVAGDKRSHEHIEQVEAALTEKIDDVAAANAAANARIEKKIDNLRWTVTGAAAAVVGARMGRTVRSGHRRSGA